MNSDGLLQGGTEVEPLFRLAELAKMTKEQRISEEARVEATAIGRAAGLAPVSGTENKKFVAKFEGLDGAVTEKEYQWLGMNYIFTSLGPDNNKDVTFTLYEGNPEEGDAVELVSYTQANVWFRANYRTNLIGNLLTADGGIEVFVSPIFDGEAK